MRLTCPNCDAQYEVDDRAIPDGGRDVQCSNCGHAWFQMPFMAEDALEDEAQAFADAGAPAPHSAAAFVETAEEPEPEPEPEAAAAPEAVIEAFAEPLAEPTPAPVAEPEAGPEAEVASEPAAEPAEEPTESSAEPPDAEPEPALAAAAPEVIEMAAPAHDAVSHDEAEDDGTAPPPPLHEPRRKVMDDSVQSVLREEAEREARARMAERSSIETQPDLGLDPAPAPRSAAEPAAETSYLDQMRAFEEETELAAAANGKTARRDLLPDIEEINSTLRATSERGRTPGAISPLSSPVEQRRGFRLGFSLVLLIAIVLLSIYVMAPTIEARAPAYAGLVQSYVGSVDVLRGWLNDGLQAAVRMINGSTS